MQRLRVGEGGLGNTRVGGGAKVDGFRVGVSGIG